MFDPSATVLAGLDRVTLQTWLTTAQTAYMQLMTGTRLVKVAYDGKSVEYIAGDRAALGSWITLLQRQLGVNCGRRALRPYFR